MNLSEDIIDALNDHDIYIDDSRFEQATEIIDELLKKWKINTIAPKIIDELEYDAGICSFVNENGEETNFRSTSLFHIVDKLKKNESLTNEEINSISLELFNWAYWKSDIDIINAIHCFGLTERYNVFVQNMRP